MLHLTHRLAGDRRAARLESTRALIDTIAVVQNAIGLLLLIVTVFSCGDSNHIGRSRFTGPVTPLPQTDDATKKDPDESGNQVIPEQFRGKLVIQPEKASVGLQSLTEFRAYLESSDGSGKKDVTELARWTSPGIDTHVKIPAPGIVQSLNQATEALKIEASFEGVKGGSDLAIKSGRIVELKVRPEEATIERGKKVQFSAIAKFDDGSEGDVTGAVRWVAKDPSIAIFNIAGSAAGETYALQEGASDIHAYLNDKSAKGVLKVQGSALQPVDENAPKLVQVLVDPAEATIDLGQSKQFKALGRYSDGSEHDITSQVLWESSDRSKVRLEPNGLARGIGAGFETQILARLRDQVGPAKLTVLGGGGERRLDKLVVKPDNNPLLIVGGEAVEFQAFEVYTDGSTARLTEGVEWSSANAEIAVAKFSGLAQGTQCTKATSCAVIVVARKQYSSGAILTAQAPARVQAVIPTVKAIKVVGPTSIDQGSSAQYYAEVEFTDNTKAINPPGILWSSDEPQFLVVSSTGSGYGQVAGKATMRATLPPATPEGTLEVNINAKAAELVGLTVALASDFTKSPAPDVTIDMGQSQAYSVWATYSDNPAPQNVTNSVVWEVAPASGVASISQSALATGSGAGTAYFTARLNGKVSNSAKLIVRQAAATVTSVVVTPGPSSSINAGTTQTFSATAYFSFGPALTVTGIASWESSNIGVASMAGNVATGHAAGATYVTATYQGVTSSSVQLSVVQPVTVQKIDLFASHTQRNVGEQVTFDVYVVYSNGTTSKLTSGLSWTISPSSVVGTPNSSGVSAALAAGTATVQASHALGTSNIKTITVAAPPPSLVDLVVQPVWQTNKYVGGAISLLVDEAKTPAVRAIYSDGSSRLLSSSEHTWVVSAAGVLSFPAGGGIKGAAAGSMYLSARRTEGGATVTSQTASRASVTVSLQVVDLVVGVSISASATPSTFDLGIDETRNLYVTAVFNNGSIRILTAAELSAVSWSQTTANRVSFPSGNQVKGVGIGTTKVKATWSGVTSSTANAATITVGRVLSDLVVKTTPSGSGGSISLLVNEEEDLTVTAVYNDGFKVALTSTQMGDVSWSVSVAGKVSFPSKTEVKGVAAGVTKVSASWGGKTSSGAAAATVTVTNATLDTINISPDNALIDLGDASADTKSYTVRGYFSDGTNRLLSLGEYGLSITSQTTGVATVSSGVATGIAVGTATIRASVTASGVAASSTSLYVEHRVTRAYYSFDYQGGANGDWNDAVLRLRVKENGEKLRYDPGASYNVFQAGSQDVLFDVEAAGISNCYFSYRFYKVPISGGAESPIAGEVLAVATYESASVAWSNSRVSPGSGAYFTLPANHKLKVVMRANVTGSRDCGTASYNSISHPTVIKTDLVFRNTGT